MPSCNKTPSYNPVDEAKAPENQPTWERHPRSLTRPFKIPRCAPSTSTSPSSTTSPRTYRASSNRYAATASRLKYRRIPTEVPEWRKAPKGRQLNKGEGRICTIKPSCTHTGPSKPVEKSPQEKQVEEDLRYYKWVVKKAIPDCNNKIQAAFAQVDEYDAEKSQAEIQLEAVKAMQGEVEYHKMCIATMAARQITKDKLSWAQGQKQKYLEKIKKLQALKFDLEIKLDLPEDQINQIRPGTCLLKKN